GVAMPGSLGRVIVARLLQSLLVMWVVVSAVFFLSRGIGDPISIMAPIGTPPAEIERIKDQEGLNDPLLEQYGRFLIDIAHGDFGKSFRANQPALTVVRSRIWASVELGLAAAFIALLVGIPIGVVAALKRGSIVDIGARALALLGQAIPGFWLGLMLILFFALRLGWLPTGGKGDWETLILPAATAAAPSAAALVRLTRAAMLEVRGQDYTRTARAKGLKSRMVITRHALRNSLLPIVTVLGLRLGQLLAGAIIVETVFAWPG